MRLFCFGLLLLFIPTAWGQDVAGWALLPNSPEQTEIGRHEDLHFVTPALGWVVNFAGEIWHTNDGGDSWTRQLTAQTVTGEIVSFRSVGFADAQHGWAGSFTPGYLLWETTDGGTTWRNVTPRIQGLLPTGVCGLWVVDDEVAYGVGTYDGPPRFIKTTDGGATWTARDLSGVAGTLIDVYFFDRDHGLAVGGSTTPLTATQAVVLETRDGGTTWQIRHVTNETGSWGWKISFPTPEIGYVSVERFFARTLVLKTIDGGATWAEDTIPGSNALQGIGFATPALGWASGRGTTSMTTDGGTTWEAISLDGVINRFQLFGDTLGYAVGRQVHKYTAPAKPTAIEPPAYPFAFTLEGNYPNPFTPPTTIGFTLHHPGPVRLTVQDMLGRTVRVLTATARAAGPHTVQWDGTDDTGRAVAAGLYLYHLAGQGYQQTRMMMLAR